MSIERVAVIGTGRMGLGIVECAASAGLSVIAVKPTPGDLAKPRAALKKSLDRRVAKGKLSEADRDASMARVEFRSAEGDLSGVPLVIESVIEDMALKTETLKRAEAAMDADAVLASNTSSLRLAELADALERPGQFIAMHFFNPVPAMQLVEVATLEQTAEGIGALGAGVCEQLGKTPVVVQAQPGYVVNRLLVPYLLHAIETLEEGVADAPSIDTAMKLGCGYPMGPLSLADLIGLDVVLAMAKTMEAELKDPRYHSPALLRRLVLAGDLGRKTGRGIFDYSGDQPKVSASVSDEPCRQAATA